MMMEQKPLDIVGYRDDPVAASHYRRPERIVASLAMLTLSIGVVSLFVFGPTAIAYVCMFLPLPFVIGLVILKNRKRRVLCRRCRQPMRLIDTKWTVEQWRRCGRRSIGLIEGRDGYLYQAYSRSAQGSGAGITYVISTFIQRWYACDSCRIRFLGEKMLLDEFFKTKSWGKWKEAQECVRSDPGAVGEHRIFKL
jgi:hypothetical protein